MNTFHEGQELAEQRFRVTRADLVAYAHASGDHNPIHQDESVAVSVGLPGVIAHGMYTLALAARAADTWAQDQAQDQAQDPGRVVELAAKFINPVVVPAGDVGVEVIVRGTVRSVADGLTTVAIEALCDEQRVLGTAKAVIRG